MAARHGATRVTYLMVSLLFEGLESSWSTRNVEGSTDMRYCIRPQARDYGRKWGIVKAKSALIIGFPCISSGSRPDALPWFN